MAGKRKRGARNLGRDRGDERSTVAGSEFECAERTIRSDYLWASWGEGDVAFKPPSVSQEIHRYKRICSMREHLLLLCGKGTPSAKYPSLAFERWLMHAKSLEREHGSFLKQQGLLMDPVIPSMFALHESGRVTEEETILFSDLTQARYNRAEAKQICRGLAKMAASAREPKCHASQSVAVISHLRKDGSLELSCKSLSTKFSLPYHIVNKLRLLWRGKDIHAAIDSTSTTFNEAAFVMLLRYCACGGSGFQAALSYSLFRDLQAHGVAAAFFSSPLNCFHTVYCSAFPDVDRVFGACCSFFDFRIAGKAERGGAWEANPPFSVPILNQAAHKIQSLLKEAEIACIPLRIYAVVPDQWQGEYWDVLNSSPYRVEKNVLQNDEWVNVQEIDGNILLKRRRIPTATCVIVLDSERTRTNE